VKPIIQKANVFSWKKILEILKRGRIKRRDVVADYFIYII
jgi:hypothetical protein